MLSEIHLFWIVNHIRKPYRKISSERTTGSAGEPENQQYNTDHIFLDSSSLTSQKTMKSIEVQNTENNCDRNVPFYWIWTQKHEGIKLQKSFMKTHPLRFCLDLWLLFYFMFNIYILFYRYVIQWSVWKI